MSRVKMYATYFVYVIFVASKLREKRRVRKIETVRLPSEMGRN